jgi:hypothetical protein
MLGTILVILLVLMLIGALPTWPYSRNLGYAPTGGLGVVLAISSSCFCWAGFEPSGPFAARQPTTPEWPQTAHFSSSSKSC